MRKKNEARRRFRVITGGLSRVVNIGKYVITIGSGTRPPFPIEAVAAEEDTWLVLSAPPVVEEPGEHIIRTMTAIMDTLPLEPGTAIFKKGKPLRFLAVVHDLEQEPSWRAEWVASALREVFSLAEEKGCRSMALPLIAARKGHLSTQGFLDIFKKILLEGVNGPQNLWLVVPQGTEAEVIERLQAS